MRVLLAGFNVDTSVLDQAVELGVDRNLLTPETLSAAYARISRYRTPVDELRAAAREKVANARRSNRNIIFAMGHHSVAEHAVFNFDLIGVSRLAIEAVERMRLCSFTEKSQRYITLAGDFVMPEEVVEAGLMEEFRALVGRQNELYDEINHAILAQLLEERPEQAETKQGMGLLRGEAKEDARYVTALATEGQLGMTLNARNLELLVRRFEAHELAEVRQLGREMYAAVEKVAPSLILFVEACDHDRKTYGDLAEFAARCTEGEGGQTPERSCPVATMASGSVRLVGATDHADRRLVSALLHAVSGADYGECYRRATTMSLDSCRKLVTTSMQHMELFDSVLREFEHIGCTFEIVLSSACFGQLKRHRMMTLTTQPYDPALGVTVPQAVRAAGLEQRLLEIAGESEELAARIGHPAASAYALLNAHRRRVLVTVNARELYHVSRLREDKHAQWDIRDISAEMVRQARDVMPLTLQLIGGKDVFVDRFRELFNRDPKVVEAKLPGA